MDFVQAFGPQLSMFYYLVLGRSIKLFFRENGDFPSLHFHNGNSPFWPYFCFICQPISKIFVALFKTIVTQKMIRSNFA